MIDPHDGYSPSHDKHRAVRDVADMPDSWGIAAWIGVFAFGAAIGAVLVAIIWP